MLSNTNSRTAERILRRLKGLRERMHPGEEPLLNIPGIWDGGQEGRSKACDIVLTNQRVMGYVFTTFPREKLFLEAMPLANITAVSLRSKTYEPLFRELLIRDKERKVYIRTSRRHSEQFYEALRSAIETYAPQAQAALTADEHKEQNGGASPVDAQAGDTRPANTQSSASAQSDEFVQPENAPTPSPVYGRQDIRTAFENSPLAITLLLVGGLALEIAGIVLWAVTHSTATGGPLFFAGLLCVIFAIIVRRQRR